MSNRRFTIFIEKSVCATVPREVVEELLANYEAIWAPWDSQAGTAGVEAKTLAFNLFCYPCELSIISSSKLLEEFPKLDVSDVIERIFPSKPESGTIAG